MTDEKQTEDKIDTNLREGQIVDGNYRIDRLIGRGGMAAVWEATNQRSGKRVAIKAILSTAATSGAAAEMLRREALAASRVNHPNVVNIYDVVDHEGLTCIVMEMLDGEPLSAYIARKGYLGVEEAATLLLPAMRGVSAANAMGVIHRDLKPQNLFVCFGADGRLLTTKVLDFGISMVMEKAWGAPLVAQTLPTHGTPAYMSPEHIQGLSDIDARADVYGFGVLFFEALTGQLPFLGEPGPELLMRIVKEPAPRVTLFRPDLPQPIVAIVERAMAKDPRDRFPGLDPFIFALEDHLMPNPSLPRALTPMAGVPLFSLSEQRSGVADPVVQVARGGELSGPQEKRDTQELFPVPRETEGGDRTASRKIVVIQPEPEPPDGVSDESSPPVRNFRRQLAKSLGSLALFAGMLLFVAWLAFPNWSWQPTDEEASRERLSSQKLAGGAEESAAVLAPTVPSVGEVFLQPDGGL